MNELEVQIKRRDDLKRQIRRLIFEKDDKNKISKLKKEYLDTEKKIYSMRKAFSEAISSVNTWSYTILGNKIANELWIEYGHIIYDHLTPKEYHNAIYNHHFPDELCRDVINNRCYNELMEFAHKKGSRIAYQVLGVQLMECGAKMSEELRELILKNSLWEDEKDKLKNEKDIKERKKYLYEFSEKIRNYKDGMKILVSHEPIYELFEKEIKNKNYKISLDRDPIF